MMKACNFYSYDTGEKVLVGQVFLNDDSQVSMGVPTGIENTRAMASVFNGPVRLRDSGKLVYRESDPITWFENLAKWYQGTYFWAETI